MKTKSNSREYTQRIVSKEQLIKDFKQIGLREGDHVAVTLSLKKIGFLNGGPNELIEAILDVIGPNGTLVMNSFTKSFPLSDIPKGYVFDSYSTSCYTGIIPETFRQRGDAIRSKHPCCSVVAVGKYAKYLTEGHDEDAYSFLPYCRLGEINGKYLCIGLGDRLVAIRHVAQFKAKLSDSVVPLYYGNNFRNAQGEIKLFIKNSSGCIENLPKLIPNLRKKGILKTGKIGMTTGSIGLVNELINSMTLMLEEKPQLTLCNNFSCLWCRELERRMNLTRNIENPRFFQKNLMALKIIELINRVRLKRFNLLVFKEGKGEKHFRKRKPLQISLKILYGFYLAFRMKLL